MIILYVHLCGCAWYFFIKMDKFWEKPGQGDEAQIFDNDSISIKYYVSFYMSNLALTLNDIFPSNVTQYLVGSLMLLFFSLLQASIFGQVSSIIQTLSRKQRQFQERFD